MSKTLYKDAISALEQSKLRLEAARKKSLAAIDQAERRIEEAHTDKREHRERTELKIAQLQDRDEAFQTEMDRIIAQQSGLIEDLQELISTFPDEIAELNKHIETLQK